VNLVERFLAKIEFNGKKACWRWRGAASKGGYGSFGRNPTWKAHRLAYTIFIGPIPKGLTLDHLCRNRTCVNPLHLEPVTQRENCLRGISPWARNARKTKCNKGHALSGKNLHLEGKSRRCRACRLAAQRRCIARYSAAKYERYLIKRRAAWRAWNKRRKRNAKR